MRKTSNEIVERRPRVGCVAQNFHRTQSPASSTRVVLARRRSGSRTSPTRMERRNRRECGAFAAPLALGVLLAGRRAAPCVTRMQISRPKPGIGKGGVSLDPDSGRGGGGVAVITKPVVKKKTQRKSKTEHEPTWRVLLHNDDVHTFDYVTGAIVKVRRDIAAIRERRRLTPLCRCFVRRSCERCRGRRRIGLQCRRIPPASLPSPPHGRCRLRTTARACRCTG